MQEKIKKWYNQGLWTSIMVWNAVDKGILTHNEAIEIIDSKI